MEANNFPKEFVKRGHEIEGKSCKHCGETEGNSTWVSCVDRPIAFDDFPEDLRSYAKYRGMNYNKEKGTFSQAYGEEQTVAELWEYVKKLKQIY